MDCLTVVSDEGLADELSDLDLLASALQAAMEAHARGAVIGPVPAAAELHRAARRARRADTTRLLRTPVPVRGVA